MITKLATFRGVSPGGEPLVQLFQPGHIPKMAGTLMPTIQEWMQNYRPQKGKIALLVNALGASEYYGANINGDVWPWSGLVHDCRKHPGQAHPICNLTGKPIPPYGYWTFLTANVFSHHRNKDPNRAFGDIVLACLNPKMKRVELVVLLDRAKALEHGAQDVTDKIDAGEYPDVSMGARVPFDSCTICGHESRTRRDYCSCIRHFGMNHILEDGRQVGVINYYPRFFDISFVFIGADKTAKVMAKLASSNGVVSSADEGAWLYGEEEDNMVKAACALGACSWRDGIYSPSTGPVNTPHFFSSEKRATVEDVSKTFTVTGKPEIVERLEKALSTAQALGSVGASRNIIMGVDGDGPDRPKVEGARRVKVNTDKDTIRVDAVQFKEAAASGVLLTAADFKRAAKKQGLSFDYFVKQLEQRPDNWRSHSWWPTKHKDLAELRSSPRYANVKNVRQAQKLWISDQAKEIAEYTQPAHGEVKYAAIKMGPPPARNRKECPYVGTIDFQGLKIYVENAAGSVREGKGWKTKMLYPYGEILGTKGTDKDRLDVYVGPNARAKEAYIVHQNHPDGHPQAGKYDEDKAMLGFNSVEEARGAYHKHYDSLSFFRSITIMSMEDFKEIIFKEKGEKVAGMQKIAIDLKLEDLFNVKEPRRRMRMWKDKGTGEYTTHIGSGLGNSFETMQKTAAVDDATEAIFTGKVASHAKAADIDKVIEPSKAVGKVAPLLSEREESLPKEILDELGDHPLPEALATPSAMGMVLKPREFQRVLLVSSGKGDLADELDQKGVTFSPTSEEMGPCDALSPDHFVKDLMSKLLPFMEGRSYLGPVVKRRIIRITIMRPKKEISSEQNSPLLSKIGAAYNWYRNEMVKVATWAPQVTSSNPNLAAQMYGVSDADLFKGAAMNFSKGQIAAVVGAFPLALMYSAHLRSTEKEGRHLGVIEKLIADHPWITSMGASAAIREIVKTPTGKKMLEGIGTAGKAAVQGAKA